MVLSKQRELGDFQTPFALARELVGDLWRRGPFARVLEPTCGTGSFIRACATQATPPAELVGIELQEAYLDQAAESLAVAKQHGVASRVINADFFTLDLRKELAWGDDEKKALVVGNPPWVTVSDLSGTASGKVPRKNIESLPGLDALTGAANFDVAEAIWVKLLVELQALQPTVALLCKQTVALRLLRVCSKLKLPVSNVRLTEIDAGRWFGIHAKACFLEIDVGQEPPSEWVAQVFAKPGDSHSTRRLGLVDDRLVNDLDAYQELRRFDGECQYPWRQGLKHDAAPVMELTADGAGRLFNKSGDLVDVERAHRFPLAKGSDVFHGHELTREVVVTQSRLGEDTTVLRDTAPMLWRYLSDHHEVFDRRRSSIYRGKPPFSLFGVGPYSFAPFKVAVSGLHREARFRVFGPVADRPVFFDDTCYFLSFDDEATAATVAALLNHDVTRRFMDTLTVPAAKRPITKGLLQRIDLDEVIADVARVSQKS